MERRPKELHPLMLAGTGSDVGKSVIAAALCRILRQDGYRPAPFKAQNMALNSYATPDGREIGRAQAVQAEAAGAECETDMNPLLLKPCTDCDAQVVLNGLPVGNRTASQLYRDDDRTLLRREVCAAFDRLKEKYNPIVMEGAGSISEINLRAHDIVNMPMAVHAGADVFLVADIDRGGVFASVYGSCLLLGEQERKHLKGVIINKFRGDLTLFSDGVQMMEDLCGIPVLGVVPYYRDIHIEEEDSVMLSTKNRRAAEDGVNVVVVLLDHMSNFTDFNSLERDPRVNLYYTDDPHEVSRADVVILPGSKNTMADLEGIRRKRLESAIREARRAGKTVLGICGGYQMMGADVGDPHRVEGGSDWMQGLGLLPVTTTLLRDKVTRRVQFTLHGDSAPCEGYEIHMGRTEPLPGSRALPLNDLPDGQTDGCLHLNGGRCLGTYIHGILDNTAFVDFLLAPYAPPSAERFDYRVYKEQQYDRLADHVRRHIDMKRIYQILGAGREQNE